MRQGRDNEILMVDGKLIGVNLGADHTAEHEWGIKDICQYYCIDDSAMGLGKRIITNGPGTINGGYFRFVEDEPINKKGKWSGMYLDRYSKEFYVGNYVYANSDFVTCWDSKSFAAISTDKTKVSQLKEIFEAFKSNDIAIWLGGGGVFKNAGLCIGIASRIPKQATDAWLAKDQEALELKELMHQSGIEEHLKNAGKAWFALSPSFNKDRELIIWLNPMGQDRYNSMWCTVEDLKQWAEDKGPVMKSNNFKRK
jgi:hypothetical protein